MPIKANAEIETMAAQLAALRGQSTEEVVALALQAELARERKQRPPIRPAEPTPAQRGKIQRVLELVRAARPDFGDGGDRTGFSMTTKDCRSEDGMNDHRQLGDHRHPI
jgi:hypothetical protein